MTNHLRHMAVDLDAFHAQAERLQAQVQAAHDMQNPVVPAFTALRTYIEEFQAGLDGDHEVGAWLVSFGGGITIHVTQVSYQKPSIVTFVGTTGEGAPVRLVQHVSQLNVLLLAVKKLKEEPTRIGFL